MIEVKADTEERVLFTIGKRGKVHVPEMTAPVCQCAVVEKVEGIRCITSAFEGEERNC